MSIMDIQSMLQSGELTARDVVKAYCQQIEEKESDIHAFLFYDKENALAQAEMIDKKIKAGEKVGSLAGIPIAIKDNICTLDMPTTCGSRMLENYTSPYEATVIEKLKAADAILIGKTNMDEFAMGNTTETSSFGPTYNPHNLAHVPGGSSGGSAAAVSAKMVPIALGSDTGGSIRQPSAYCGIFGLKPTYGSISRYGCVAFASSLDQIGPMANSVEDLAILMNVIAGYDVKDSTSAKVIYPDYSEKLNKTITGMKIGVPEEYLTEDMEADVKEHVQKLMKGLERQGAIVEICSMPNPEHTLSAYYLIATAEASSNLARFDGVRYGLRVDGEDMIDMFKKSRSEGFGDEVKRRIILGTYALSAGYYDAYYKKALQVRTLIKDEFEKLFKQYDLLLTPTTIKTAPVLEYLENAVDMYKQDVCTVASNLTGYPAISVPYGKDQIGLPIGMQFIGRPFEEAMLLQVASAVQTMEGE